MTETHDGCLDRGFVLLGASALARSGSRASATKPDAAAPQPDDDAATGKRQARSL